MLRERFGIYTDATCPSGKTVLVQRGDALNVCRTNPNDASPVAPTCASGTPYMITTEGRENYVICVPSTTTPYPLVATSGPEFPCRAGDYFGVAKAVITTMADYVCIPAAPSTTTTSASTSSESLPELSARLTALRTQYTDLVNQGASTPAQIQTLLPQIQSVNQQIAAVLDKMLTQMQYTPPGPNSDTVRAQLVEQLARIQSDYNGLKTNTDALQTLNRIRSFQDTSWKSELFLYLMGFLVAALLLVLVMLFRRQKTVSAIAPSTNPAAIAPLT